MDRSTSSHRRRGAALALLIAAAPLAAASTPTVPIGHVLEVVVEGAPFQGASAVATSLASSDVFVADPNGNGPSGDVVHKVSGGAVTTFAPVQSLFVAGELVVGPDDALYVWDAGAQAVLKILPDGTASTFQSFPGGGGLVSTAAVLGLAIDLNGDLFAGSPLNDEIYRVTPAGVQTTFLTSAQVPGGLDVPGNLAFAPNGDLIVVDYGTSRVLRVTPGGVATVVTSGLDLVVQGGLAVDPITGDIYVTELGDRIVRIDADDQASTFASGFQHVVGLGFGRSTSGGTLSLYAAQWGGTTDGVDGDALYEIKKVPTVVDGYAIKTVAEGAPFEGACALAVSPVNGDIFVCDPKGNGISSDQVLRVTPGGAVSDFYAAGALAVAGEVEVAANGDVYVVDGPTHGIVRITPSGVSSLFTSFTGGSGSSLAFAPVLGLAFDAQGNLFAGSPLNDWIYKITPAGVASIWITSPQVPGGLDVPGNLHFAPNGDLIVYDYKLAKIVRITPTGGASIVADDLPVFGQAGLGVHPTTEEIYFADGFSRILKIDGDGAITTFACGFNHVNGVRFGPSTSGSGTSLYASQYGTWIAGADGDAVFEIVVCPGDTEEYGAGVAGAGGLTPRFSASGCPSLGCDLGLHVTDALGGTFGLMIIGLNQTSAPMLSGTLLVEPALWLAHTLGGTPSAAGDGALSLGFVVPDDAALANLSVYFQSVYADSMAPGGVSMTNGLRITIQ